jgi:hypothetical protein
MTSEAVRFHEVIANDAQIELLPLIEVFGIQFRTSPGVEISQICQMPGGYATA